MKKLAAKFFIALALAGGIPGIGFAKTNSPSASTSASASANYGRYRLPAYRNQVHRVFLKRGYARIIISGDGDTDLDLYVYGENGELIARAESNGDDESIPLDVYRSGYFIVKVVNRGEVYNDYALAVQ